MTATKEVKKTTFCTKCKNLFRTCSCSEKVSEKIVEKNEDVLDCVKIDKKNKDVLDCVKIIEKNEDVFDFVKLKPHMVKIIMNYLDLHGYLKMIQLNQEVHQYIDTQFGVEHLTNQINTILNRSSKIEDIDLKMLHQYALYLRTKNIPAHVYLKQFTVSEILDTQTKIYVGHDNIEATLDEIKFIDKKRSIPTVIIVISSFKDLNFVAQIDQWRCESIRVTSSGWTTISFDPKTKTETNLDLQLTLTYKTEEEMPHCVEVAHISLGFGIYQNGYYEICYFQEDHTKY